MTQLLGKALWYRRRLASMSTAEVFHRLDEAVKRRLDYFATLPELKDYGAFTPLPGLRQRLDDWMLSQELLEIWNTHYHRAVRGEYFLLNKVWPPHERYRRWHLDPVTEKYWPKYTYAFDIDYRHNPSMGDVKYVWELNRLNYLQPIAALAFKLRDADIGRFCLKEIEEWIDQNPPYRGINWCSGIELALRAVSILFVLSLVGEYLTPHQRAKIWQSLNAHAQWLERYPSKYSSSNNHQTAEGLGLLIIGSLCSQLPGAEQWRKSGWVMLLESAQNLILRDGAGAEQALSYLEITLEMLTLGQILAALSDLAAPKNYLDRIQKGNEFLQWMTDCNGNRPNIGDDDNGFVLDSSLRQIVLPQDTKPLTSQGIKVFEEGGYTTGRIPISGQEILFVFDHGNLGYQSIAAHGHADTLSFWLHLNGHPVFVDAGTYLYHSGGRERDAFRGTAAHNTLCMNSTNSSIISGAFNWLHKAHSRIVQSNINHQEGFVEAEHDGYVKKYGSYHRRRVSWTSNEIIITDVIYGPKEMPVDIGFLLHPSLTVAQTGDKIAICRDNIAILNLHYDGPLQAVIKTDAWYSPAFGLRETATRLIFTGHLMPEQKSTLQLLFG